MKKVGIVDYHLGNLRSVYNAIKFVGAQPIIMTTPNELLEVEKIILPGVGAFATGMDNIVKMGWVKPLENAIYNQKKDILGICLGMQLLATFGFEDGKHMGLDWIKGEVIRIQSDKVRIPHIGWNSVRNMQPSRLFQKIDDNSDFYFVHSFYFKPDDVNSITGTCDYGEIFPAGLEIQNIYATQFHPEKSQKNGIQLLYNFIY
jgi:imidazole glycerol-phosphate synthase subunit HisH